MECGEAGEAEVAEDAVVSSPPPLPLRRLVGGIIGAIPDYTCIGNLVIGIV